jgi:large subunit ribosomal protein L35
MQRLRRAEHQTLRQQSASTRHTSANHSTTTDECERIAMPKNKTHSGTKKRVKVTGTGKLMHAGSGKRHNLESKPTSRTRRLDGSKEIAKVDTPRLRKLLGI